MGKQKQWRTQAAKINREMGEKHQGRKFKNDPRMAAMLEKLIREQMTTALPVETAEKVETAATV